MSHTDHDIVKLAVKIVKFLFVKNGTIIILFFIIY